MREWGIYRSWARLCAVSGLAAIVHDVRPEHAAEDAADLLAHVHREAKTLGIAGEEICLWSCSANVRVGHPLAYDPANTFVKAAVFYYGNTDSLVPRPDLPVLVGRGGLDNPGTNGALDRFVARALQVNAPVTLLNVHNGHHAFDLIDADDQSRAAVQATLDWMAAQLSPGVERARAARSVELEARRLVAARQYVAADRALRLWLADDPDNGHAHYALAGVLYQLRRFDDAGAEYERTASLNMMTALSLYNGACSYSLAGNGEKALALLERALATGAFRDRDAVRRDPDFASLVASERFNTIVSNAPVPPGATAPGERAN